MGGAIDQSIDRAMHPKRHMHMHVAVDDQAILTLAIYVLSQAQHVMTKLLKSKDGCKLKP
eukprot:scaffold80711_cov45-Phaeocystis_antarctica.AAC.1